MEKFEENDDTDHHMDEMVGVANKARVASPPMARIHHPPLAFFPLNTVNCAVLFLVPLQYEYDEEDFFSDSDDEEFMDG